MTSCSEVVIQDRTSNEQVNYTLQLVVNDFLLFDGKQFSKFTIITMMTLKTG